MQCQIFSKVSFFIIIHSKEHSKGDGTGGLGAPHISLTLKILIIKLCWLANNIVDDLTHTKLTDCDKKTLSHYNSYL